MNKYRNEILSAVALVAVVFTAASVEKNFKACPRQAASPTFQSLQKVRACPVPLEEVPPLPPLDPSVKPEVKAEPAPTVVPFSGGCPTGTCPNQSGRFWR